MSIQLSTARPEDRPALEALLRSLQLPVDDLPGTLDGFTLAFDNGVLVGSAGVERLGGSFGLLRSVAVHESYRSQGLGQQLYAAAIERARSYPLHELWLITNTADRYFERQGFERIERSQAPEAIAGTAQFSSLCPSSSVVMRKLI